jgi:hypothetical protein
MEPAGATGFVAEELHPLETLAPAANSAAYAYSELWLAGIVAPLGHCNWRCPGQSKARRVSFGPCGPSTRFPSGP